MENAAEALATLDQSKDGKLDREELQPPHPKGGPSPSGAGGRRWNCLSMLCGGGPGFAPKAPSEELHACKIMNSNRHSLVPRSTMRMAK